jgi:hypothetical protein
MRKRKEGWEEANSWHAIYPVVSVGTKRPLVHIVEALTQEYCFLVTKSLPRAPLDSPQSLALRHSPSSLGHLDAASTKELLHQGRGSPCPPHKVSSLLHTKPEGRRRLPVSHLGLKASSAPCTPWFTQESAHKVATTLHSLISKLSLALSICKSMDKQLSTWMDWIWYSRCLELLCTSAPSSYHKLVSGGGINSPRHPKSRWLTTTEKGSVRWTNAMLFQGVGSSGALHTT